jgi:hypothetical protein
MGDDVPHMLYKSWYLYGQKFVFADNHQSGSINTYLLVFYMKQLKPDLANAIVQTVGWSSIEDTNSIVTKKDIEVALQYFLK